MAQRVFLHIGTMKSATTYLQELASANAGRLADQGVLWPDPDLPFLALSDLLGRDDERPGRRGAWADLVRALAEHPGTAVFSNELLAPLSVAKIRRVVEAFEPTVVELVITASDLSRVIPSHWQTTLKNGSTTPWSEFASAVCQAPAAPGDVARSANIGSWFWRRHDVAAISTRWQEFVPAVRTRLVTVPAQGLATLVADRFVSALGASTAGLDEPRHSNTSVGAHSAELLRRLNAANPSLESQHYRWGIKGALVRGALANWAAAEPRFGLTEQQHTWVKARAELMIEEIAASRIRVVGDLDDLRPPTAYQPGFIDPGSASDADLLAAALHGLDGMASTVADLRVEQERFRVTELGSVT